MRISVVGGGAVGCLVAARLAANAEVSLVVRRAEAAKEIRRHGIRMTMPAGREVRVPVAVSDDPLALGPQDLVIVCVKAYALKGVLHVLPPLSGPETRIMPVINGIPWWYPVAQPAPLAGHVLASVDPDGLLSATIDPDRLIGAVTYVAVENQSDGVIRHVNDQRFVFGDPAGRDTPSVQAVADLFVRSGFEARASADIRSEIWTKLWGNLAFNPLSVLTGAALTTICTNPGTRDVSARMMAEARAVAERLGVTFGMSIDKRIAISAGIGDFKTSMLQDYEAGRRLELEAIVGAAIELADMLDLPVPTLRTIFALTDLRAKSRAA